MDDRDFDPPEFPESRAEYLNRYLRHFHACILIIALGTLVSYFACSLEFLEQHEFHLNRQLQHVRDVREQQSCVLSAISSISRNLTGWAGIDRPHCHLGRDGQYLKRMEWRWPYPPS